MTNEMYDMIDATLVMFFNSVAIFLLFALIATLPSRRINMHHRAAAVFIVITCGTGSVFASGVNLNPLAILVALVSIGLAVFFINTPPMERGPKRQPTRTRPRANEVGGYAPHQSRAQTFAAPHGDLDLESIKAKYGVRLTPLAIIFFLLFAAPALSGCGTYIEAKQIDADAHVDGIEARADADQRIAEAEALADIIESTNQMNADIVTSHNEAMSDVREAEEATARTKLIMDTVPIMAVVAVALLASCWYMTNRERYYTDRMVALANNAANVEIASIESRARAIADETGGHYYQSGRNHYVEIDDRRLLIEREV